MFPSWLELRSFGNSRIARVSYLFPFIGHFIIFSTFIGNFIGRWTDLSAISSALSIGTVVVLYYFGFLLFSFASIVYAIFCPSAVKRYSDDVDFIAKTDVTLSSGDLLEYSAILIAAYPNEELAARARGIGTVLTSIGIQNLEADLVLELRKAYFKWQSYRRAPARFLAGFCYLFGIILVLIPTVVGISSVVRNLAHLA